MRARSIVVRSCYITTPWSGPGPSLDQTIVHLAAIELTGAMVRR